jgi:hypothetical protein
MEAEAGDPREVLGEAEPVAPREVVAEAAATTAAFVASVVPEGTMIPLTKLPKGGCFLATPTSLMETSVNGPYKGQTQVKLSLMVATMHDNKPVFGTDPDSSVTTLMSASTYLRHCAAANFPEVAAKYSTGKIDEREAISVVRAAQEAGQFVPFVMMSLGVCDSKTSGLKCAKLAFMTEDIFKERCENAKKADKKRAKEAEAAGAGVVPEFKRPKRS